MNIDEIYKLDLAYTLGMSLTFELLKYHKDKVVKVIISNKVNKNENWRSLIKILDDYVIDYEYDDKLINRLSLKENCYVIGFYHKYEQTLLDDNHYVLVDAKDAGEVGTIMRTMASFGFNNLVLINSKLDVYDPKIIRSSMGGCFLINAIKIASFNEYLSIYQNHNLYYFNQKGNLKFDKKLIKNKYSLIFGLNKENSYYVDYQENLDPILISACILNDLKLIKS